MYLPVHLKLPPLLPLHYPIRKVLSQACMRLPVHLRVSPLLPLHYCGSQSEGAESALPVPAITTPKRTPAATALAQKQYIALQPAVCSHRSNHLAPGKSNSFTMHWQRLPLRLKQRAPLAVPHRAPLPRHMQAWHVPASR